MNFKPISLKSVSPSVLLALAILGVGLFGAVLLVLLRGAPSKEAPNKVAALVSVLSAELRKERVLISGFGTVEAARELEIRTQVGGQVVERSDQLEIGGRLEVGATLLKIDPRDYQIAVDTQAAAVTRAEFELQLEKGNQVVAKREWELFEKDLEVSELGKDLALRKPHIQEKRAALKAAKSKLERANLDLERTHIRAPFPALVISEAVEVGQYVSPQTVIGKIVATDQFYIQLRVSRAALKWLAPSGDISASSTGRVRIIHQITAGERMEREGRVIRLLGNVDSQGRMLRLIVAVENPLNPPKGTEPLLLGSYVQVEIEGPELTDVFRLPQKAIREGSIVWVADKDQKLAYRHVEEVFTRGEFVFVRGSAGEGGLGRGEQVIVSPLQGAMRGLLVTSLEVSPLEASLLEASLLEAMP